MQCPNDDKRCICTIRSLQLGKAQGLTTKNERGNGRTTSKIWYGRGDMTQRRQLICKWHVKFGIFWGYWKNTERGNQEEMWQKALAPPKWLQGCACRPKHTCNLRKFVISTNAWLQIFPLLCSAKKEYDLIYQNCHNLSQHSEDCIFV